MSDAAEQHLPRGGVPAHRRSSRTSGDLSPRLMQLAVTRPLEEAARTVLGVRRVRSKTIRGACEISVLFNPDADMPYALQLMQGKTDEVKADLPAGTELAGRADDAVALPDLQRQRDREPAAGRPPRPRRCSSCGRSSAGSRASRTSRCWPARSAKSRSSSTRERLNAAKLTLDQVAEALEATNQVTSVGRLPKDYRQYLVLATAELAEPRRRPEGRRRVPRSRRRSTSATSPRCARGSSTGRRSSPATASRPRSSASPGRSAATSSTVADGARAALQEYRPSLPPSVRADRSSTTSPSSCATRWRACATPSSSAACSRCSC